MGIASGLPSLCVGVVQDFRNGHPRPVDFSEARGFRLIVVVRLLPLATTPDGCSSCLERRFSRRRNLPH
jgi:hypothetical protein